MIPEGDQNADEATGIPFVNQVYPTVCIPNLDHLHEGCVFDRWFHQRILNVIWTNNISNTEIKCNCFEIPELCWYSQFRRLQWFRDVLCKIYMKLTKCAVYPYQRHNWKYRLGGQTKTRLNTVKADVDELGLAVVDGQNRKKADICEKLASDRPSTLGGNHFRCERYSWFCFMLKGISVSKMIDLNNVNTK